MSIEVRDVTLSYGKTVAVDGLSFHLNGPGVEHSIDPFASLTVLTVRLALPGEKPRSPRR